MVDPAALVAFSLAAFVAATLVTMTGFGLSTSLTPIFALVYRTHIAVMLVAVIHFLNNLFRVGLFRKHIDLALVRRFGILSIAGALAGSLAQGAIESDWLKLVLGVVLVILGGIELVPGGSGWRFPRQFDQLGGLLSGLLGGLLGNQGAIRSAYLVNYNIPKESFIATGTLIAIFIDSTRIPIYLITQWDEILRAWPLLLSATLCAYAGTYTGKRLVGRISQRSFKRWVNFAVVFFGLAMIVQGAAETGGSQIALAALLISLAVLAAAWLLLRRGAGRPLGSEAS